MFECARTSPMRRLTPIMGEARGCAGGMVERRGAWLIESIEGIGSMLSDYLYYMWSPNYGSVGGA